MLALLALELDAEGLFERLADGGERRHRTRVIDAPERVAGIGGEEPGDVLGLPQRNRLRQRPLQVLAERMADAARRLLRRRCKLPERRLTLGDAEALKTGRPPRSILADQQEVAVVRHQNQAIEVPVFADLFGLRGQPGLVGEWLDLDDAALGFLPLLRLAPLALGHGEQSEVGVAGAGIFEGGEAEDTRFQAGPDGVQEVGENRIIRKLLDAGAKAARRPHCGEVVRYRLFEGVGQGDPIGANSSAVSLPLFVYARLHGHLVPRASPACRQPAKFGGLRGGWRGAILVAGDGAGRQ